MTNNQEVFHDNGAAFGRRTRVFRNCALGGVEWMYAVDYAGGDRRWYGYMCTGGHETVGSLIASGMDLRPYSEAFSTELTPEGEQTVIPGCERNAAPTVKQLDLWG